MFIVLSCSHRMWDIYRIRRSNSIDFRSYKMVDLIKIEFISFRTALRLRTDLWVIFTFLSLGVGILVVLLFYAMVFRNNSFEWWNYIVVVLSYLITFFFSIKSMNLFEKKRYLNVNCEKRGFFIWIDREVVVEY